MQPSEQSSPSMNGKSYQGLSLPGLAAHIASSILLWDNGKVGTKNDCKHAIAHNVRAYQRRLIQTKPIRDVWITENALSAEAEQKPIELEHAIPVGCLMNLLFFKIAGTCMQRATAQVIELIEDNTVLVWVTPDEHAKLNKLYQSSMPPGHDTYPWKNKLGRYTQTDGISTLHNRESSRDETKPAEDDLDAEIEGDFSVPK